MKKLFIYAAIIAVVVIIYKYATKTKPGTLAPVKDKKPLPPLTDTEQKYISTRPPYLGNPIMKNIKNGSLDEFTPAPPVVNSLTMKFDTLENAGLMIAGDASDLAAWNTFFDMSNYATTPFNNISVTGTAPCTIELFGGTAITMRQSLFSGSALKDSLLEVDDSGCVIGFECDPYPRTPFYHDDLGSCQALTYVKFPLVTAAGDYCFAYCTGLISPDFSALTTAGGGCFKSCTGLISPDFSALTTAGYFCFTNCTNLISNFSALTTAGDSCFSYCTGLVNPDFSSLITAGDSCFAFCTNLISLGLPICATLGGATWDNYVFVGITGKTITITIPAALNTDGDVLYLQANNTVTIINP